MDAKRFLLIYSIGRLLSAKDFIKNKLDNLIESDYFRDFIKIMICMFYMKHIGFCLPLLFDE